MLACTPVDFALLDALARYRLLSIELAERLGIARRWHIGTRLGSLETAGLVHVIRRGKMLGPHVYMLTPKGAKTLEAWAEEDGEARTVPMPRSPMRLGPHLVQRLAIAEAHVSLRTWAAATGAAVEWVRVEFDPSPSGLEPATRVTANGRAYTADALAHVTATDGRAWLLAVEMETGGMSASLDNFRKRLPARLEAFENEVLEDGLQWMERAARLLFVFPSVEMMDRAKRLVADPARPVWRKVFFNSLPSLASSFSAGWWQADGSSGDLFRAVGRP